LSEKEDENNTFKDKIESNIMNDLNLQIYSNNYEIKNVLKKQNEIDRLTDENEDENNIIDDLCSNIDNNKNEIEDL